MMRCCSYILAGWVISAMGSSATASFKIKLRYPQKN
jgi:hypothetical protein